MQDPPLSLENHILNHILTPYLFFPRRTSCLHPYWVDCEGGRLCCSYTRRGHNRKTIVHFHGNGETVHDFGQFHAIFDALGFDCLLAEYRGYGQSTGQPSLASLIRDVAPLLSAVPEGSEGIILHGRSFGSIPALAALRKDARVCGLILESAIADLLSFGPFEDLPQLVGMPEIEIENWANTHFDHRAYLECYNGPTLIMHCRHDWLVPFTNAVKLHEWANEPKTLKVFEVGDHNTFLYMNLDEYLATLKGFLEKI